MEKITENGKKYYVHIRLKGANSRISLPSNEVVALPRPEGQMVLHETKSKNYSAFDFEHLKMVASKNKHADIVFDFVEDAPKLRSPHLRKKKLRKTLFVSSNMEEDEFSEDTNFYEEITLSEGQTIIAKTERGNYARLTVEALGGSFPDRFVRINYAYQLIKNLPKF